MREKDEKLDWFWEEDLILRAKNNFRKDSQNRRRTYSSFAPKSKQFLSCSA